MIDLGFVLAALIPLILSVAGCSYEVIWRTSFAIGVLPRECQIVLFILTCP